jgi:hypothetical protein
MKEVSTSHKFDDQAEGDWVTEIVDEAQPVKPLAKTY